MLRQQYGDGTDAGALAVISHHRDDLLISPTHACIVGLGNGGTEYKLGEWAEMEAEVDAFFEAQHTALPAASAAPPSAPPQPTSPSAKGVCPEAAAAAAAGAGGVPDGGTPPPAVVEMDGVSIAYGERVVFDKLQWTVREGDKWVVLGGNGSGKSTLLELVTGENMLGYAWQLCRVTPFLPRICPREKGC